MDDTKMLLQLITKVMEEITIDIKDDNLSKLIANRLRKAATEEKLLRNIEIEEEIENTIEKHIREKQALAEKNNRLIHSISQKDQTISEKDKLIEELKKQLKKSKG